MKECILTIKDQYPAADNVYKLELTGDISQITAPGQFVNIALDGFFLRRPISVCDAEAAELPADTENHADSYKYAELCEEYGRGFEYGKITLLYKEVGHGTKLLSELKKGTKLNVLTGLGNGFDTKKSGDRPLLIGGGIGSAPMLMLAKRLISEGKKVTAVLGFNSANDVILENELKALGTNAEVIIMTADGSCGKKGLVSDILKDTDCTYFYACGPMPMLRAVYACTAIDGELSFEERMGCGFGACVGCSAETKSGVKRVCKDGPVFAKGDIIWKD